ncbi:MAG TPA: AgmX/PglI C-terminal domain-containing protein [Kofleriaceae bacterium]|nr:AgmX/PglI C-terminal domain-containing protein [Kofleriaceae bacterium]
MATARSNGRSPGNPQQPTRVRSLRVGIILGGKIIEERLVRKRETISIGQSAKNTFSVPIEGMPRSWPLFVAKDEKFYLHFSPAMDGRVSDGGQVHPLQQLRSHGAQPHGEGFIIPLPDTARGKIVLGEMTLLFQFVTAPPLQPRPHLPASLRGTLSERIDPQLAIIVAISMMAHLMVMLYARCVVDPKEDKYDKIYKATFPEEYDDYKPQQVAVADVDVEGAEGEKAEEEKQPDKPASAKKPAGDGPKAEGTPRPAKTEEELAAAAELAIAELLGEDSDTGVQGNRMRDRNPGNNLADEARQVEEGRVSVTLKDQGGDQGPNRSTRRTATTTGPDVKAGGDREGTGPVGPAKVPKKPVIDVNRPDLDGGSKTSPAEIMAKIQRQYVNGLKRCYERVLKLDETAAGTVKLRFTVGTRGTIIRAQVKGFGFDTLDSCVEGQVNTWVFGPFKDEEGDPTEVTVNISLPFTGR